MNATLAVTAQVRHAVLGSRPMAGPILLLPVLLVLVAAGGAVATWLWAPPMAAVLVLPAVVLAVSMAVLVLDQARPRGLRGPWVVLPVPRRIVRLGLRAPSLLIVGVVVSAMSPAVGTLLVSVGVPVGTAVLLVVTSVLAGVGGGLLCSVVASILADGLLGRLLTPVASAPAATVLWLGWTACSVWAVRATDGWFRWSTALVTGWPRLVDGMVGEDHPVTLAATTGFWAVVVAVLAHGPLPPPHMSQVRLVRSFGWLPLLTLVTTRVLRARPTQVHLLMAAVLVLCLLLLVHTRPDVGPPTGAVAVVALCCAVVSASARGLDGPVPLEVRWQMAPARHVLLVVLGVLLCASPLAVVGVLGSRPARPDDVVVQLSLCVAAGAIGVATGALLGAPAGHPASEAAAAGTFFATAFALGATFGERSATFLVVGAAAVTATGLLTAVAAQTRRHTQARRGLVDPRDRRWT